MKTESFADANYNIIGIISSSGRLVERYEYTPYGQRTVYTHGWYLADMNGDGLVDGADYTIYSDNYGSSDPADIADLNGDGEVDQADYSLWCIGCYYGGIPEADSLVMQPTSKSYRSRDRATLTVTPLCEFGHQGLMHDEEIGYKSNWRAPISCTNCYESLVKGILH